MQIKFAWAATEPYTMYFTGSTPPSRWRFAAQLRARHAIEQLSSNKFAIIDDVTRL
jgi:hypothetical protein